MKLADCENRETASKEMGEIVDDYLDRLSRGERPSVAEYVERYPALADVIEKMLPTLGMLHITSPLEPTSDRTASDEIQPKGPLGDFQIVREIGRGGMGVVYEAEQISLGRTVALKVLPFASAMDSRQLQRFKNEALAAAHLDHPNIVDVYGVGCERGVHYYAMRYIEGQSLANVIQELRGLQTSRNKGSRSGGVPASDVTRESDSPDVEASSKTGSTRAIAALSTARSSGGREYCRCVARLVAQAADALDHAHQMGVIHRDVKPANLMLDPRGNLWVTDFGLAQVQTNTVPAVRATARRVCEE